MKLMNLDTDSQITMMIKFLLGQVKAITVALSVPMSSVKIPFEKDARKFKQWIKEVKSTVYCPGNSVMKSPRSRILRVMVR